MNKKAYIPRLCDTELQMALESSGAVLLEGPKWCGKTSTAAQAAYSVLYMQDPDSRSANLALADTKPSLLLVGQVPRLIDEWQMAPVLWDAVRFEVDRRGELGQFILTGSAVPVDNATAHTGTGRISRLKMRTMSLFESGESTGSVSLAALFDGTQDSEGFRSELQIDELAWILCRGGWPASLKVQGSAALRMAADYVESIINHDISELDGVSKNPDRVRSLLRSLARNTSTTANYQTIIDDLEANDQSLSSTTVSSYFNALRRIFVVENLPAWMPSIRSKTAIRTSEKRHFVDPSIATAALRMQPSALLKDFETFGLLFESLCTRDIRVYAQSIDGDVFHFRDKTGLEADLIVRLRDRRWGAIEVKLGQRQIEEAAKHLLAVKARVDSERMGEPSFLMVLTGGEYAYQRPDGIWVVPLACLKN
jgi:predicted AAA+ superfamily ATPase